MAQEYKVTKISSQPPREYEGQYGKVYYVKVMLDGHARPVEIGKKDPKDIKEGDTVYGTITDKPQFAADSFKSEKQAFMGGGGGRSFTPRDDQAIKAQWAIGQAVALYNGLSQTDRRDTYKDPGTFALKWAKTFYGMVEQVKGSDTQPAPETPPQPAQTPQDEAQQPDPVVDVDTEEPINLDDIPFN